jgi:hypothetical protein
MASAEIVARSADSRYVEEHSIAREVGEQSWRLRLVNGKFSTKSRCAIL